MDAPDHGSAENGQLAHLRHALQFEIRGEGRVAADVGQHGQRARCNHRAADGQAVESVGEIHGIARSHDHQRHEGHERQERQRPKMRDMRSRLCTTRSGWNCLKNGTISLVEYIP